MLRTLIISAAAIGLSGALLTAPAFAHHKPGQDHGGGGGGGKGDATFAITLANDSDFSWVEVAAGNGVEGSGSSIDGTNFGLIKLTEILTVNGTSNVAADYNDFCGDNIATVGSEAIDDFSIVDNPEIGELHVVISYSVGEQSFILVLTGPGPAAPFPPEVVGLAVYYPMTGWGNRGGGKGRNNRCNLGGQVLDGVTLTVTPE